MDKKFGTVILEIPNIEFADIIHVMAVLEKTMEGLRKEKLVSDFEHFHINADIDHFSGVEIDEEEEKIEKAIKDSRKRKPAKPKLELVPDKKV